MAVKAELLPLPCPFCGGRAEVTTQKAPCKSHDPPMHHHGYGVSVSCGSRRCAAHPSIELMGYLSEKGLLLDKLASKLIKLKTGVTRAAIKLWNKRPRAK